MEEILRDRYLSAQRFNRYLFAAGNQEVRARKLYAANLKLAQAFHPVLSQFEVVLRNTINGVLTNYFSDPEWIYNQRLGFMNDPSLASSKYFLRESVHKTVLRLMRQNLPVTAGKIITDQMFGFWSAFYISHHYSLIGGQSIYVFIHKPASEGRSNLLRKLEEIKSFRNRMNHCEPLCFKGRDIDCTKATAIHSQLYDLIKWMDPNLIPYFRSIDKVPSAFDLIARI